jgi:hypothetical protein
MLCWPRRSCLSASNWFPRGTRRSLNMRTESRWSSLRLAISRNLSGHDRRAAAVFRPLNRSAVPPSANDLITLQDSMLLMLRQFSVTGAMPLVEAERVLWNRILRRPNAEFSCAAESPARSEPRRRHPYESEDRSRRQLQRDVMSPSAKRGTIRIAKCLQKERP